MTKGKSTYRIALSGLFTAVMLVLGYIEHLIPLGGAVPGIKLGLANSVLLYALYTLGARATFVLMLTKVVLSGLMFGGVSAMIYSLAGGLLSVLGMIAAKRISGIGIVGCSIIGAVLHNVGQVALAMAILNTSKLLYYLAILMLVAVGTGLLTGIAAGAVLRSLEKNKLGWGK